MKKSSSTLYIELSPTKDILKELGKRKRKDQVLIGFALETDNEIENAQQKLQNKNLDFIVLNSLNEKGAGFGLDTNKVTIIDKAGHRHNGSLKTKQEVASDILDIVT
jgi:phosphopantothenoylcysteine decarboxylase/phosphopantothenate--cysteine ligase